jgi:NAD(P)-dependent dehydrogenase (short-subunit alcohol dehydrogenase family)
MDVTSINEVEDKIEKIEQWFEGGINCLIHFAGVLEGSVVDIDELTPETWNRIININLNGTYNVTRAVAKHMKKRNSGVILLTSSGAGVEGPGSSAPYSSSKGGTHGLTLHLQQYLANKGIRIHDILPGSIRSPLKEGQLNEAFKNTGDKEAFDDQNNDLGDPEGVAKIVAFIISDEADYLRGSIRTR